MEIGIFGGSFDPVHIGHLMIASYCRQWCDLDEVWLMVSPRNPLKEHELTATARQRVEMVDAATESAGWLKSCDLELEMPVPSFTADTLRRLTELYPEHKFTLIIGGDNLAVFDKWKDWKWIADNFKVLVYLRPGEPIPETVPDSFRLLTDAPQIMMSSTWARRNIKENKNLNYFLAPEVVKYIDKHNLYKN